MEVSFARWPSLLNPALSKDNDGLKGFGRSYKSPSDMIRGLFRQALRERSAEYYWLL